MKQTIVVSSEELKNRAIAIVLNLPVDEPHDVAIKPHKADRSTLQNSYYWRVLTIIGSDLGMTKDEMHDVYKEKFLVPIFTRDDEGYAEMVDAIKDSDRQDVLTREMLRLTSTTQCTVKQMSELIDDIQHHAASLGIRLPAPEWMQ